MRYMDFLSRDIHVITPGKVISRNYKLIAPILVVCIIARVGIRVEPGRVEGLRYTASLLFVSQLWDIVICN